jgi:hypothetical protein
MVGKTSLTLSLASIFDAGHVDIIYICVCIISMWSAIHTDDGPKENSYANLNKKLKI